VAEERHRCLHVCALFNRRHSACQGAVPLRSRPPFFVTTPPSKGLGTTVDLIRRIVADDPVLLDLLDQALQNPDGNPHLTVDNVNSSEDRPAGNAATHALRRLRRERPDLHARVLARELSPHAALLEAG